MNYASVWSSDVCSSDLRKAENRKRPDEINDGKQSLEGRRKDYRFCAKNKGESRKSFKQRNALITVVF